MAVMRILALACLAALTAPVPSVGQTAPASTSKTAPAAAPATVAAATTTTTAVQAEKDGTGKDGAATLEPRGFTYNPEGRRDPFVTLQRRGSDERGANRGSRPSGLSGISTSEVSLRGTMKSPGGFVGILQGVDNKSYIVRVGDKLFDGSVRSITADAMVILQQVDDPLSLQKEREVRKQLRQTEEAK
jgi:Tfp pilus assembly protein PilP